MTKIAVVGGKLQGLEICYLAMKAGIETVLIDKNPLAPARGLATKFIPFDILLLRDEIVRAKGDDKIRQEIYAGEFVNLIEEHEKYDRETGMQGFELIKELKKCNLIIPALENEEVLKKLVLLCKYKGFNLAFDEEAYKISSSKLLSDQLFLNNKLPAPKHFPEGNGPYIAKPIFGSGSKDVIILNDEACVNDFMNSEQGGDLDQASYIIQEYMDGPAYSIEVIGSRDKGYKTYQITEIFVDESYDCNRVTSFTGLSKKQEDEFSSLAINLANLINLNGIMDVEVILNNGELKLLEIDARFPSQTPTAIYASSGINLLSELIENFHIKPVENSLKSADIENSPSKEMLSHNDEPDLTEAKRKFSTFEHFLVEDGQLKRLGEHIISEATYIEYLENFMGSDEALTDIHENCDNKVFRFTMINSASTMSELESKRNEMAIKLEELGRLSDE